MMAIKPTRILHVVGAMNRGGTETMLMNLYRKIDHRQVQFDFISYSEQEAHYDQEIKRLGGRVIRLTKTSSIKQIYQAIKSYGPYAAIHAHTLFHCGLVNVVAKMVHIPIRISHAHTTLDHGQGFLRKTYLRVMRRVIRKYSTHFLACSKAAGLYLFGEDYLSKETYRYFPNVIDYQAFQVVSQAAVNKFKVETGLGDHLVFGHIGTFKAEKNHSFLLDIMKQMKETPQIKMILVGDGELKNEMVQQSMDDGLAGQICFLGVRDDVKTILNGIDVFILPSITEGLGLVLLEAQASGIPCLVSEAIQPEADMGLGLLTTMELSKGPKAWAMAAIKLAKQREYHTNKINAHFEANGYAIHQGINQLMGIYGLNRGDDNEASIDYIL